MLKNFEYNSKSRKLRRVDSVTFMDVNTAAPDLMFYIQLKTQ